MRQVKQEIPQQYAERFTVFNFSLGRLRGMSFSPSEELGKLELPQALSEILQVELPGKPEIVSWKDFYELFSKDGGLWDRPLILLIDEVDTIPSALIDLIAAQFRELYLRRETNWLHGLALIGVRAVLGIESQRGSPFNIQRSLHVPNLRQAEVQSLYQQYQDENGQRILPEVVEVVYTATNGQPGLVSWFGELLTETYNPGHEHPIDMEIWKRVWLEARTGEPSNNLLNIIAKARDPKYQPFLAKLFTSADIPFLFHNPLHNYLYLHGILEPAMMTEPNGELKKICRFSSPFIQQCLYDALSDDLIGDSMAILPLEPLDELTDVFEGNELNLLALLRRYKDYLSRLKARGLNPWKEQPRRKTDFHLTEAVGHFHLYAWLQQAIGRRCVVSPKFPTGNGKVDIHLKCGDKRGIIEVKSFVDAYQLDEDKAQAARYAKSLGFDTVTLTTFVPVEDETVLAKLSGTETIDKVQVSVVAIGWV